MSLDRIGRAIVIASALTLGAAPARADEGQGAAQALVTVHQFLRDEPSSDPDSATLRYGILGGRWAAMGAQTTLGARLFPPPINPGSIRAMRWAFLSDVRVSVRATDALRPFIAGYFELVGNDFVAAREGFRGGLNREPLRYRTISAGLELRAAGGAIVSPEIVYSSSHGRGVDFPRFYGPELGLRLGFLL